MISQFFVLSPRGDTIISRDFRGDVVKGTAEIFFRKVKRFTGDAPPAFFVQNDVVFTVGCNRNLLFQNLDGISFIYVKKNGLYFLCTTQVNASPSYLLEILNRISKIVKDYCGVLSEESIRKNFVLVYELIDEILDFGYPQMCTTESLKAYVHNEPILVNPQQSQSSLSFGMNDRRTTPSTATSKPIALTYKESKERKSEVFLDLLERLTVLFSSNGTLLRSEVDGTILMKSYLTGNPELHLALNEDLMVGASRDGINYGLVIDDVNFHECANVEAFESDRAISFVPPEGEFEIMHYRMSGEFRVPFRVFPFIDEAGPNRMDVLIKVRADVPQSVHGSSVVVRFPIPANSTIVQCELGHGVTGQAWEYKEKEKVVLWSIKKFMGGMEHFVRAKKFPIDFGNNQITLSSPVTTAIKREIGPVNLDFEVPMYSCSGVHIRFLRVADRSRGASPFRWVRYITHSNSYVCRMAS